MSRADLPDDVTSRAAAVYVRQSTLGQVQENLESQRRQYGLADLARSYGFREVHVIDDDLGRSGSGLTARPGFEHLVTLVCTGTVGAVFALEASRLARNGKDWHRLVELCGIVGTRVIDGDGVYDPRRPNDRLLLGLKGTMSEFELTLLRSRLVEAQTSKARRGEFRFSVPVGYVWPHGGKVELDPDVRVQDVVRLIFRKFAEFGSAHQILRWLRREGIEFPKQDLGGPPGQRTSRLWRPATYRQVVCILKNPFYAGVYAYGKSEAKVEIKDGQCRKTYKHARAPEKWTVRLAGHHTGYIDDAQFARNQEALARNSFSRPSAEAKSARGGRALLAGLLRCRRCGHKLTLTYSGTGGKVVRYSCCMARRLCGEGQRVWFGATRPDLAVGEQILAVVQPHAVDAAILASQAVADKQAQVLQAKRLEVQQAEYEARLAARRYEAVDPDNRLVAGELEARWNAALTRAAELREDLQRREAETMAAPDPTADLHTLARDLASLWHSDRADMRLKQRIVRTLIVEIMVDRAPASHDAVLTIHWRGGRHSTLTVRLPKTGEHRRQHTPEVISLVRSMAGTWSDEHIAAMLNRGGHRTGQGLTWNAVRVGGLRQTHGIPAYAARHGDGASMTMLQAAQHLGVTCHVIRRLIKLEILAATQVMLDAPWQIRTADLDAPAVREFLASRRTLAPCRKTSDDRQPMIPGI